MKSCPTSKEEWDIAARKKNCRKQAALAEEKNCRVHSKQLEYHCLINAFRNKSLEVCEAAKTIFGEAGTSYFNFIMEIVSSEQVICKKWLKNLDILAKH